MKTPFIPHRRVLGSAALAVVCLFALPLVSQAKGPKDQQDQQDPQDQQHKGHKYDHARQIYSSHPRSSFALTLGTGYAGRGYYYGPPNSEYYYEGPEVRYYATREAAPREYYSRQSYVGNSTGASVQSALARSGFYRGPIDGQIGPQSSQAIANYQQSRGLRVTGSITNSLLRSLGLQ